MATAVGAARNRRRESVLGSRLLIPALVLLATLAGLALRLVRWDFQPLWWDEGYSVWFATHTLDQMAALTAQDIHPPLYYALLHGWTLILGAGPLAFRSFSVVAGVLEWNKAFDKAGFANAIEVRQQPDFLNDVTDATAETDGVPIPQAPALHQNFSGRGDAKAVDQLQECGFAASAAAEKGNSFAPMNFE